MNKELQAAFDALNAQLNAIDLRLGQVAERVSLVISRQDAADAAAVELRQLVSDTQAAAINAQRLEV